MTFIAIYACIYAYKHMTLHVSLYRREISKKQKKVRTLLSQFLKVLLTIVSTTLLWDDVIKDYFQQRLQQPLIVTGKVIKMKTSLSIVEFGLRHWILVITLHSVIFIILF